MPVAYPLAQVLDVKKRRAQRAREELLKARDALDKEEKQLEDVQQAFKKVDDHFQAKLFQLRSILDTGTTTDIIQQMRRYLTQVQEKKLQAQTALDKQKKRTEQARTLCHNAQTFWQQKQREVEKIDEHKKVWHREQHHLRQIEEIKETDAIGNTTWYQQHIVSLQK